MADSEAEEPPLLLPCAVCCRTFRPESLAKHAKICEKNATKRRKTFDSSKQRIQGTDLAEFLPILHAVKKTDKSPVKKTQSKWKEKHMEFVRAIRAARITDETRSGGPGIQIASAPPPRPMDHERCPHCDRFFGPKAFDRHVDWCKEQKCRIPKSPASLLAKERWEARIKYRAPSMNRSKRSMTREKYLPASRKNSGGLERDPSPVIRSNSDSFTPSVMTTSAKRQAVSPSRKPAKESVSSPACNMKRNIAQRVSVRQRSASPKKSPLGLKSTTNRKVKASDPVEVIYSKESPLLEGKGDDNMSASYNISQIQCTGSNMTTPAADKDKRSRFPRVLRGNYTTPSLPNFTVILNGSHPSSDRYDPYVFAERQMMELLSVSEPQNMPALAPKLVRPSPLLSSPLSTSPISAFARYNNTTKTPPPPPPQQYISDADLGLEDLVVAGQASNLFTADKRRGSTDNAGLFPIEKRPGNDDAASSDVTSFEELLNLCSTPLPNDIGRRNRYRAKIQQAALSLQQSVSLYHSADTSVLDAVDQGKDHEDNLPCLSSYPSSSLFSSPLPSPKPVPTPLEGSRARLRTRGGVRRALPGQPTSRDEELSSPDSLVNNLRSYGSKISADSAYSSLNRKSPNAGTSQSSELLTEDNNLGGSVIDLDRCCPSSSSSDSSLPQLCSVQMVRRRAKSPPHLSPLIVNQPPLSKMSKFCHECGHKYPLSVAKFCCECGVRRLVI